MTTLLSNFPSKYTDFFFFFRTFEDHGALKVEASPAQAADPHDYTLYYCTCHLFSLALGMFAMVTAHSGLLGADPRCPLHFPVWP